jgi:hypothetical protein
LIRLTLNAVPVTTLIDAGVVVTTQVLSTKIVTSRTSGPPRIARTAVGRTEVGGIRVERSRIAIPT